MVEQQQQRLALALFSNPKNGGKLRSVARLESLCGSLKACCPALGKCYKIYYANKMRIADKGVLVMHL